MDLSIDRPKEVNRHMAVKQNFHFGSSDGVHRINGYRWMPDETPYKGIVQIVHGMVEYVDRYDDFARFMTDNGYIVVGEDHLGHGGSVDNESEWGYFAKSNGFNHIINDLHTLHQKQAREFPQLPYFFLGHSMGSFLTRIYISKYGDSLSGAIIMGTGNQPPAVALCGKALASIISLFKGEKYRSKFINNMAFGSYNKPFKPARTTNDWLTKDEAIVDAYLADPRCTFVFTLSAYKELFDGVMYVGKKSNIARTPKNLPLLLTSGARDPVGGFGKGVIHVYDMYKAAGIDDVSIKLYDNDRHEILNETDREQVYADILAWIVRNTR